MNIVNVGYDSTNYYVLADAKPRLLVDAGWPGTLPKLQGACKRMGIQLTDMKHFLVTHFHPDHAGLTQELKRLGLRLVVMENQPAFIAPLKAMMKPENHYIEIDPADNIALTFAESRAFLAKIGVQGEIIPTPGHSDDSVTLILDEGAAFTGDLTPPLMASEDNYEIIQQSWAKIRVLGAKTLYPGHGPAVKLK